MSKLYPMPERHPVTEAYGRLGLIRSTSGVSTRSTACTIWTPRQYTMPETRPMPERHAIPEPHRAPDPDEFLGHSGA